MQEEQKIEALIKACKKGKQIFGKEEISKIPIGYVEVVSREINKNKKSSNS